MRIDGTAIANSIFEDIRERVGELQAKHVTPHLVVLLVGDDPASVAYVEQKKKKGEAVGVKVTVFSYPQTVNPGEVLQKVKELNNDPSVHGIIVQRPLPESFDLEQIARATNPQKDVDSFHPDSPFNPPIAEAVIAILQDVSKQQNIQNDMFSWLKTKQNVIIGKGETAGHPIIHYFQKRHLPLTVVDSKTQNTAHITKAADILISAVGKRGVVTKKMIKKGVILISVGLTQQDHKLQGDYNAEEIQDIAAFYTPTPGGVGPINVAKLFKNVLIAVQNITERSNS